MEVEFGQGVANERRNAYSRAEVALPRVLVVRSEQCANNGPVSALESAGYPVSVVQGEEAARAAFQSAEFRIIVCCWTSELDAIALCNALRNDAESYIYCILLTEARDQVERQAAVESGVDEIIQAPFDDDELLLRLLVARRFLAAEYQLQSMADRLRVANQSMEYASRRFEELFNGLPVACFTIGQDGMIHDWNREAEAAFEIPAAVAFMRDVTDILGLQSHGYWSKRLLEDAIDQAETSSSQWALKMADGSTRHFVGNLYPFQGPNGQVCGVISANVDITDRVLAQEQIEIQMAQMADLNRRLELLSVTDGLTGLRNHRYFQDRLNHTISDIQDSNLPVSLILLDVDHFKKFNDSFGHVAGDGVLKRVAGILSSIVQEPLVAARYGGEEFAIIVPHADESRAARLAEQLRAAIESNPWQERAITASFGVATTRDFEQRPKELIEWADEALYRSKAEGRNRVTLSSQSSERRDAA
jgi:diguanylate cyclase (GGDEF)-like protein/PAS domain S-box-containing protein